MYRILSKPEIKVPLQVSSKFYLQVESIVGGEVLQLPTHPQKKNTKS